MARRPTPTATRILEGNPGHRPIAQGEPAPALGLGALPECVAGNVYALDAWNRIAGDEALQRVICAVDTDALVAYCMSYALWREAECQIKKLGAVVETAHGLKKNPWCTVSVESLKQMRALFSEFGLTPASRTRVKVRNEPTLPFDQEAERKYFGNAAPVAGKPI